MVYGSKQVAVHITDITRKTHSKRHIEEGGAYQGKTVQISLSPHYAPKFNLTIENVSWHHACDSSKMKRRTKC